MNRPRIAAAVLGVAAVGSFAGYVATLNAPEPAGLRSELAEEALANPATAPLVAKLCPECGVAINCYRLAGGDLCRKNAQGAWVRFGVGFGGVRYDGTFESCTPQPTDEPWPCDGPDHDWPRRSLELKDSGDDAAMIREVNRVTRDRGN